MNLTFGEIKARYEIEWKNRGEARTTDDTPMGWDLVTPERMTNILTNGNSEAPAMQPPSTSLKFIGRMAQAMEDLNSLGALDAA